MRRIAPLVIAPFVIALLALTACSDSDDDTAPTSTVDSTVSASPTSSVDDSEPGDDPSTTEEPTTTEAPAPEPEPETTEAAGAEDEIGLLCSAYLASINPATFDQGLTGLAAALGNDAPAGVLDAIDTLQNPNDDVEAFFRARNSIDSYVLPVCEQRFRRAINPLSGNTAAADAFVAAVRAGDRPGAERLAPTNVIVQFDWTGYPLTTADISPDGSTLSMVLEPTVTVFCQLDGGAVEFCAFGE